MKLDIDDRIVQTPTASDVEEALGARSFAKDWRITIEDGDATLDATARSDGSFLVTIWNGTTTRRSGQADTAAVKTAFVKYLNGDGSWKKAVRWDQPAPGKPASGRSPLIGRNLSEPPPWAIVAMVIVIGFVLLMFTLPGIADWLFPFARSDWFWIGLIFLPMAAIVLLAAASKGLDLVRASSWEPTSGRIVSSRIAQRSIKFQGEAERIENYAAVTYEFKAPDGRKVQGSRIGIGNDNRGADAAPTVKRYPAGAIVTVYYDPKDPRNCVLERGGPKGIEPKGCAMALGELAIAGGILWAWIVHGPGAVKTTFPNANENIVTLASGLGVFLGMMAYAQWRMSRTATGWPATPGTVMRSEVHEERDNASGVRSTSYRPIVEYAYTVAGNEYRSAQVRLNVAAAGPKAWADSMTAKYPQGRTVNVRFDPENPSNAVLENPGSTSWYLLALAAAAFAFAAWQTHALG